METIALGGTKYVKFLRSWEGGTSDRQTDSAHTQHPGIHTVKGITWNTWKDIAKLSYEEFLVMTDAQWYDVYGKYYTRGKWPANLLDELVKKYPLIGYNLLESCWKMGNGGSEALWANFMRRWFGYGPANITPKQICEFFLKQTSNYDVMCKMMYSWRKNKYYAIGGANLNGWLNRLNNLYWYFASPSLKSQLGITKNIRVIPGI